MQEMVVLPATSIGVGEYFLISNYDAENSALSTSSDLVTTAVSLSNSKLLLQIRFGSGEVIDTVDDGTGAPFAGRNDMPKASMQRVDLSASGRDEENWETAETSIGFDEDVEAFGTPGMERGAGDSEEAGGAGESSSSSVSRSSPEPQVPLEPSVSSSSQSSMSQVPSPSIILSEILANPKGSDDVEWIEVQNSGDHPVDIAGFIITDESTTFEIPHRNGSGFVLQSGEYFVFKKPFTGISLSNDGEKILLKNDDSIFDEVAYPKTGEEVSFGRLSDGTWGPSCIPSPGKKNSFGPVVPHIRVQSGRQKDTVPFSINVEAFVQEGSLDSARCLWIFAGRETSNKCNPPSFKMEEAGKGWITLDVETLCGKSVQRRINIEGYEKEKSGKRKVQKVKTSLSSSSSTLKSSSLKSSSDTFFASSFYPSTKRYSSNSEQKMYTKKSKSSAQFLVKNLQKTYRNISELEQKTPELPAVYTSLFLQDKGKMTDGRTATIVSTASANSSVSWNLLALQSVVFIAFVGRSFLRF